MGFDRTYEGLKHDVGEAPLLVLPGFDRTYEGLKLRLGQRGRGRAGRFDRTYEGLKLPPHHYKLGTGTASFDRTYEGLKPNQVVFPVPGGPSFDRTYEGLKSSEQEDAIERYLQVLTVPMRV